MGTWGISIFENDTAADWLYDLEECNDLSLIELTIDKLLNSESGPEWAISAEECLAAIETIASLKGNWGIKDTYTESLEKWINCINLTVPDSLLLKAKKALKLIKKDNSDLAELWKETEDYDQWFMSLEDLEERLS